MPKATPKKPVLVQFPPEHPEYNTGRCARLKRHMYGTRAAADGWNDDYGSTLVQSLGFTRGVASPCAFHHSSRGIIIAVYGDDFIAVGKTCELDWYARELAKHYDFAAGGRLGGGEPVDKESRVLNRIVRWANGGIEYEADPRQVERFLKDLGMVGVNPVVTPGLRPAPGKISEDAKLDDSRRAHYRSVVARANYLAADRPDIQSSAKGICRFMSEPTELGWEAVKRLVRYLAGRPRLVIHCKWQHVTSVEVYTDTDWAGCPRTRKSTLGGCLMIGTHVLKSWSSTQASIALSSGEADFYGVVKGSGIGLGFQTLLRDIGRFLPLRVHTDSSAAEGLCKRQGLGKLRHVETHTLWVQDKIRRGKFSLHRVPGSQHPADLFTKYLRTQSHLDDCIKWLNCQFVSGRPLSAPQLRNEMVVKALSVSGHGRELPNVTEDEPISSFGFGHCSKVKFQHNCM